MPGSASYPWASPSVYEPLQTFPLPTIPTLSSASKKCKLGLLPRSIGAVTIFFILPQCHKTTHAPCKKDQQMNATTQCKNCHLTELTHIPRWTCLKCEIRCRGSRDGEGGLTARQVHNWMKKRRLQGELTFF